MFLVLWPWLHFVLSCHSFVPGFLFYFDIICCWCHCLALLSVCQAFLPVSNHPALSVSVLVCVFSLFLVNSFPYVVVCLCLFPDYSVMFWIYLWISCSLDFCLYLFLDLLISWSACLIWSNQDHLNETLRTVPSLPKCSVFGSKPSIPVSMLGNNLAKCMINLLLWGKNLQKGYLYTLSQDHLFIIGSEPWYSTKHIIVIHCILYIKPMKTHTPHT